MEDDTMKVEVSNGEIVDKLTILRIKEDQITDVSKLANVCNEICEIEPCLESMNISETSPKVVELREVNTQLWEIEDRIRALESESSFDEEFVALARMVYITNDRRARLKREINEITGSDLVEEKSYQEYSKDA